jgi:hypothetical protein
VAVAASAFLVSVATKAVPIPHRRAISAAPRLTYSPRGSLHRFFQSFSFGADVTTTRPAWWLALEPALLALAVVVCGGMSLPAHAGTTAIDRDRQCDTSDSNHVTSTVAKPDSTDDGDDDGDDVGDCGDALLAAPIVLTTDDGLSGALVQTELDVRLTLRSERLSSRGPPDRDLPSRVTANSVSSDDDVDNDDDDDDDDDDDGDSGELPRHSSTTSDRGQTWILIVSEFDALISFTPDNHSLRAPPQ